MNNQTAVQMCPPSMKALQPFLVRSRDFDTKDPQIAYLCKSYAAELGIQMLDSVEAGEKEAATQFLMALLDHLEEEKADETKSKNGGKEALLKCSLLMFKRADDRERSGQADKTAVSMFLTSSCLMEVTKQFGEMDPDVKEKQMYAKVTASRIKKALDAGIPYESPNAPLVPEVEEAQPQPPQAPDTSFPPPAAAYPVPGTGVPQPTSYSDPMQVDPVAPPPPPPAAVNFSDMDSLLAQLTAQGSDTHEPETPANDDVDEIQARLNNLRGSTPQDPALSAPPAGDLAWGGLAPQPAAPAPAAPAVSQAVLQSAETTFHLRRIEELETETTRLRHELAMAQTQKEQNAKEMMKYQQAVQLLQQQLASASRPGGAATGNALLLTPKPGFEPNINDIGDAQKFSKYVTSALQFKDITNARDNLLKAMAKINGHA